MTNPYKLKPPAEKLSPGELDRLHTALERHYQQAQTVWVNPSPDSEEPVDAIQLFRRMRQRCQQRRLMQRLRKW